MKRPFLLGLTGSIGMGKSTTAAMFAEAGIPVWDADRAVEELYSQGGAAVGPVSQEFPQAEKEGAISKQALKEILKETPERISKLESIVHPLVAEHRQQFIQQYSTFDILLFDIPLLFETGQADSFDAVVVVTVPADIQRERVLARNSMSEELFEQLLAKQMPDAEKREKADYIIETLNMVAAKNSVHDLLTNIRAGIVHA